MKALSLSVLDLVPIAKDQTPREALQAAVSLAQVAEETGYKRFWVAEHHNSPALLSSSPEILLALIGNATERIRVGSGGVMLPNHSPLRVAEQFLTLEALFPKRVDLGLGRAPGTDGRTAAALRRTSAESDFGDQIEELRAFAGERPWPPHSLFRGVSATPRGALPPLYILGSSSYGAALAGRTGRPYSFAHHFSEMNPRLALQQYRDHFRPSEHLSEPWAILGVSVVIGENEAEAQHLALAGAAMRHQMMTGTLGPFLSPDEAAEYLRLRGLRPAELLGRTIVGDAAQVHARLQELAEQTGAQEIMLSSALADPAARQRGLRLLAAVNDSPR